MKRIWAGEVVPDRGSKVGPAPARAGGPELQIGGYAPRALKRVGKSAAGFIGGGLGPDQVQQMRLLGEQSWRDAGRPRLVVAMYCAVGVETAERAWWYIRDYSAFLGPGADQFAQAIPVAAEAVRVANHAYADIGADVLMLWPCVPDLDQVDRLAERAD